MITHQINNVKEDDENLWSAWLGLVTYFELIASIIM